MIKAVLFDMDGLLIDSEPLWRQAEKKVFGELGVYLEPHMFEQMMGYRIEEVVAHWRRVFGWQGPTDSQVIDKILAEMQHLINTEAKPLPGVDHAFAFFQEKELPMAIASSSHMVLIETVVAKLGIEKELALLHSAQLEEFGKPHPQVFLTSAEKLNVLPAQCLVFEDSVNGVIAAKAAKMKTIAIPEPNDRNNARFAIADAQLDSLLAVNDDLWNSLISE